MLNFTDKQARQLISDTEGKLNAQIAFLHSKVDLLTKLIYEKTKATKRAKKQSTKQSKQTIEPAPQLVKQPIKQIAKPQLTKAHYQSKEYLLNPKGSFDMVLKYAGKGNQSRHHKFKIYTGLANSLHSYLIEVLDNLKEKGLLKNLSMIKLYCLDEDNNPVQGKLFEVLYRNRNKKQPIFIQKRLNTKIGSVTVPVKYIETPNMSIHPQTEST